MKTKFYLPLIAGMCLLAGCDKGSTSSEKPISLKSIDLSGAKALLVAETSTSSQSRSSRAEEEPVPVPEPVVPKLFRVTASGDSYEAEFLDQNDNPVPVEVPEFATVHDEYVILHLKYPIAILEDEYVAWDYTFAAVDPDNGAVLIAEPESYEREFLGVMMEQWKAPNQHSYKNYQKDNSGAIYFRDFTQDTNGQYTIENLCTLHTSGNTVLLDKTPTRSTPSSGYVNFWVNGNGDVWIDNWTHDPQSQMENATLYNNGVEDYWFSAFCLTAGGNNLDAPYWMNAWGGHVNPAIADSFISFDCEKVGEDYISYMRKYTPGAGGIEKSETRLLTNAWIIPRMPVMFVGGYTVVFDIQRLYTIDAANIAKSYLHGDGNAYGGDYFPRRISDNVAAVVQSNNYIYDFSSGDFENGYTQRNVIRRFNPADGTVVAWYEVPSKYNILSVKVTPDDVLSIGVHQNGRPAAIVVDATGNATEHTDIDGMTVYQYETL
jgi:hypothetical protein